MADRKNFVIQRLDGEGKEIPGKSDLPKMRIKILTFDCDPVFKIKLNTIKCKFIVFIKFYLTIATTNF